MSNRTISTMPPCEYTSVLQNCKTNLLSSILSCPGVNAPPSAWACWETAAAAQPVPCSSAQPGVLYSIVLLSGR